LSSFPVVKGSFYLEFCLLWEVSQNNINIFFCFSGKYIGNRPIKLRKSTWKDRSIEVVKKKVKEKKRLGYR